MTSSLWSRLKLRRPLHAITLSRSSLYLSSSPFLQLPKSPQLGESRTFSPVDASKNPAICRCFCSKSLTLDDIGGPTAIDYSSLLPEDEFHRLADGTIHDLLEKFEEYGDNIQVDGFDIDYGNQVLTLKLGSLGTYVINKQTPNRQIWLSSPVSGPSRFDWDRATQAWMYRRTKENLLKLLEDEMEQLCGEPINLS